MNVICRSEEIEERELPQAQGCEVIGHAGQSFNLRSQVGFNTWISGSLSLPPGAGKDAESVGEAIQVFFVVSGQPGGLEVAYGPADEEDDFDNEKATRFILSPGDEFYVPSFNAYSLKNHSSIADCELRFMIMKQDKKQMLQTPTGSPSSVRSSASKKNKKITTPSQSLSGQKSTKKAIAA
jgi:uncharacterized RmlC-like cupin family protein